MVKKTMSDYTDSVDKNENQQKDDGEEIVGFRNCPFCGGEARVYVMRNGKNGSSAFAACTRCHAKSNPVWLRTHSEVYMINELRDLWNKTIYDKPIRELKTSEKKLKSRITDLGLTEAQCMKRSYRKFKGEDWQ